MKTAVVTGASGFIGKALTTYLLKKGITVYAVVRNADKLTELKGDSRLHIVEADFEKYESIRGMIDSPVDVFYHLAWTGAYGKQAMDYGLQLGNAKYACDALMTAIAIQAKKFVLAGTIAEVEVKKHIDTNICNPRMTCIYGTAKLAAEMMCKTIAVANHINFNCAILANTFGPGDYSMRSSNFIISKLNNGEAPRLVPGNNLNDWLYIDDTTKLLFAIGDSGIHLKTYYVGHSRLVTLKEIITEVRDVINPDIRLNFGELQDEFATDYTYTNVDELYKDTNRKADCDFKESILKTAEWVKMLNL